MQDFRPVDTIAERDVLEGDVAADGGQRHPAGVVDRLGRGIKDVAEALDRQARLMKVLPGLRQPQDGRADAAGQQVEGDQLADSEVSVDDELGPKIESARRDQLADELHRLACGIA